MRVLADLGEALHALLSSDTIFILSGATGHYLTNIILDRIVSCYLSGGGGQVGSTYRLRWGESFISY